MEISNTQITEELYQDFLSEVIKDYPQFNTIYKSKEDQQSLAQKFLFARKLNVTRAAQLFVAHQNLREKEALNNINPIDESVRRELLSGKFTVLLEPDRSGAIIAIFTVRLHFPSSLNNTLRALILQLDAAMESENAQRHGVIFIYDMYRSKLSNFDYQLSIKIISMLQGCYPARLRRVYIVSPPFWFRAPFKLLQLLREKLRQRVHTVNSREDLIRHFSQLNSPDFKQDSSLPKNFIHLPQDMGGHIVHSHREWLKNIVLKSWLKDLPNDYFDSEFQFNNDANNDSKVAIVSETTWEECCIAPLSGDDDNEPASSSINSICDKNEPCPCNDHSLSVHQPDDADSIDLLEFIEHINNMGYSGLMREYLTEIQAWEQQQKTNLNFASFKKLSNQSRNRYSDVKCIEDTRVILHLRPNGNEYIHANWVDGYRQKNAFICAQGPLPNTVEDLWAMVWEYHIPVIVMTTKLCEQQRTKCHLYWPDEPGQKKNFEINSDIELNIVNEEVINEDAYKVTHLTMCNIKTSETRKVVHLFFHAWPDHAAPDSSVEFLALLSAYRNYYAAALQEWGYPSPHDWWRQPEKHFNDCYESTTSSSSSALVSSSDSLHHENINSIGLGSDVLQNPPPCLVHCSAGIGRTGTFVAMDINTKRLEHIGKVSLIKSIRLLRAQRFGSVQTARQYVFLYATILDYARDRRLLIEEENEEDEMDADVESESEMDIELPISSKEVITIIEKETTNDNEIDSLHHNDHHHDSSSSVPPSLPPPPPPLPAQQQPLETGDAEPVNANDTLHSSSS